MRKPPGVAKTYEIERDIDAKRNALFTKQPISRRPPNPYEALGRLTDARKKDADEQAKQAEQSALRGVDSGETEAKGAATLQEAKLPTSMSAAARAKATEAIQQQELAKLKAFEEQKFQIQLDYYSRELSQFGVSRSGPSKTWPRSMKKQKSAVARVYDEIDALKQAHNAKMQQFTLQETIAAQDAANKQTQAYTKAFQEINQGFETATAQNTAGHDDDPAGFRSHGREHRHVYN